MSSISDTLTRCPHCETRFRVTKKQLAAANGKVRCGHCLCVFNAIEHAQPEESEPQQPEPRSLKLRKTMRTWSLTTIPRRMPPKVPVVCGP